MELKPGYKQTEVGVIPEDWDVVKIGTISKITTGPFGTLLKASEYSVDDNGAPLISVGEVRDGFVKITGHTPRVPPSVIRRLPQYILRYGDIVFGRKGAVDRSALITEKEDGCFLGSDGISVRLSGPCNPAYISCQLRSHRIRDWLVQNATGTTMASLNQGILKKIPLALPPRPEQDAIASTLSELDELIQGLDELATKKRNIKQSAMQELLTGKRRLPGFEGEWEVKKLGDTASLKARIGWQGLTTAEYLDSGDVYLVTGTEIEKGRVSWHDCHYVDEARYKQDKFIQLKPQDVLVTKDGTIGKVALVTDLHRPATLNSGIFVIRPTKDSFNPEFFYYLLCSQVFSEFLGQLAAGSTINHLYQKDFVSFTYRIPPTYEEQDEIASTLNAIDSELIGLEARLDKTRAIKQAMMQELLTGRIRLR
jgi:type I restriction enzyme S subunit